MNFFGHAVVAGWQSGDPNFALGAMLPDFASMIGGKISGVDHPVIARGIDLHHKTDAAFHQLRDFFDLCAEAGALLRARGIRRGPVRGAAHVAVELCLDGYLAGDGGAVAHYLATVAGSDPSLLRWQSAESGPRFAGLLARLADAGAPRPPIVPDRIARRVSRALASHPLLAVTAIEERDLSTQLPSIDAAVAARAPALIANLRRALR